MQHTCKICNRTYERLGHLSFHVKREHRLEYKTYYDLHFKTRFDGKCKTCNSPTHFYKGRYKTFCSSRCSNTDAAVKEKNSIGVRTTKATFTKEEIARGNAKRKATSIKKYGVENVSQLGEIKKKKEDTHIQKTGVAYYTQEPTGMNRYQQTCLERYGTPFPLQNLEIKNKTAQTNLKRFGFPQAAKNPKIQEKIRQIKHEKTYKSFVRFSNIVVPQFDIQSFLGGKQKNTIHSYPWKCTHCNTSFKSPYINGKIPRCLVCHPITRTKLQKEIVDYLKFRLQILDIQTGTRKIIPPQELDMFLPEYKLAIEFNGLFWHGELSGNKTKKYHLNKLLECEKRNIRLIQIFEDEWIHTPNIVKARLSNLLHKTPYSIGARKCAIRPVEPILKNLFLNKYHLQGADNSSIRLGAFYKNRLVALMTFCKPRIALGGNSKTKGHFELSRFCTLSRFTISGIASKLLSHFETQYKPISIKTYADRRWSTGNLYRQLKFKHTHISKPNYWYIPYGGKFRFHRYNFRKSLLKKKLETFNSKYTEWQNMQNNNYDRIWDCGTLVFEKTYN